MRADGPARFFKRLPLRDHAATAALMKSRDFVWRVEDVLGRDAPIAQPVKKVRRLIDMRLIRDEFAKRKR
jgi:hypothetical protein